jgi:hypothetical protein
MNSLTISFTNSRMRDLNSSSVFPSDAMLLTISKRSFQNTASTSSSRIMR